MKVFQSYGGGEFGDNRFESFLLSKGVIHQLSCPKMPEQNGLVKRKRKNVTELGLTTLFHGGVPKRFWVEVFGTTIWLINWLPSRILGWKYPFELLLVRQPDYSFIRTFVRRWFPYLRDYAKNKFDLQSLPCVFLGYSHNRKGYRCYSHKFAEITFPFCDPSSLFSSTNTNEEITSFDDWFARPLEPLPPVQPIIDAPPVGRNLHLHLHYLVFITMILWTQMPLLLEEIHWWIVMKLLQLINWSII